MSEWRVKESEWCVQVSEWVREGEWLVRVEVSVVREWCVCGCTTAKGRSGKITVIIISVKLSIHHSISFYEYLTREATNF